MTQGYLLFTTHDGDELDASFIPDEKENQELIHTLRNIHNDRSMEQAVAAFSKWNETAKAKSYRTQTRCFIAWPFNNVKIIGTFYCLVY